MFPVWMMRTADTATATSNEQTGAAAVASNGYKPATKEELDAITAALNDVHDERDAYPYTRKHVASEKTSRAAKDKPDSEEVLKALVPTLKERYAEYDAEVRAKYTGEPPNKTDLNAITAGLQECNDERNAALATKAAPEAEKLAEMKHTSICSEIGCLGCQPGYRLNGQAQADFAVRELDLNISDSKEKKGGPLDEATVDCVAM